VSTPIVIPTEDVLKAENFIKRRQTECFYESFLFVFGDKAEVNVKGTTRLSDKAIPEIYDVMSTTYVLIYYRMADLDWCP